MCGIATISIGKSRRGRIPYPLLRKLVQEMLVELQFRGMDASGIAVVNEGGPGNSVVFKKPLRASRLVVRPKFKEVLEKNIGPQTNFILLHTRATSVGHNTLNYNNHPIVASPIVGVHNGTLYNEDRLFESFKLDREGTVDSEVIFRLYEHFLLSSKSPRNALTKTTAQLEGAFTGALVDMRHTHRMLMFKFDRALHLIRIPFHDVAIAISHQGFYRRPARKLGLKAKTHTRWVSDGTGFAMDVTNAGDLVDNIDTFDIPVDRNLHPRIGFNGNNWFHSILGR